MWSSDPRRGARALFHAALGIALIWSVGGCGFKPLYGDMGRTGAAQADLALIDVELSADRAGQRVRQMLIELMNPKGVPTRPRYSLKLDLAEAQEGVGLRLDYTITRVNYRLNGDYRLIDLATGKPVTGGKVRGITAYNIGADQVATLTAETDARERAEQDLARDLTMRLAVFFEARAKAQAPAPSPYR